MRQCTYVCAPRPHDLARQARAALAARRPRASGRTCEQPGATEPALGGQAAV